MNNDLINEAISLLHSQHDDDLALEIEKLQSELARVKRIAGDRFDKIAELRRELAKTRRELEDTRSDLILTRGHLAKQRSLAGQLALELAQIEDDPRRLEDSDD